MAAKVICMASAKGGSGKTLLSATFGAFLASLEKRVLLIDTDAATTGLTLLYLKEAKMQADAALDGGRKPRGIYDVSTPDSSVEIVKLKSGVHLIPATYEFLNPTAISEEEYKLPLFAVLSSLRESYDYIFLDAPPGSDVSARLAMSRNVSDEVVIVSEYDPLSAAGVTRLKGLLRADLTHGRTWVLLNKMLPDFVQTFSNFLEVVRYLSPIPWDADVVRAYARGQLALDLERGNEHTLAVMQTLKSLLGDEISEALSKWRSDRAAAIRQPIELQYNDTEKELELLWSSLKQMEFEVRRKRVLGVSTAAIGVVMLGSILAVFGDVALDRFPDLPSEIRQLIEIASRPSFFFLILFAVVLILVASSAKMKFFFLSEEAEIKEARIRRRAQVLEDKLRKLEALRQADPETLFKKGSLS